MNQMKFAVLSIIWLRFSQIGVVSFGEECPSHAGVYARVTEFKHWIQFIAQGAMDSDCNQDIPYQPGNNVKLFENCKYVCIYASCLLQRWLWLEAELMMANLQPR